MIYRKEQLRDIYPHASKINVFKFKLRKWSRIAVNTYMWLALAYIAFYGVYTALAKEETIVINPETKEIVKIVDKTPEKIEQLKDEVIKQLMDCESGGHARDAGIVIFDSNEVGSFGAAQFQKKTVQHYYHKYYGEKITGQRAVEIAIDPVKAAGLAKKIIFDGGVMPSTDWYNCSVKHGLDEQVALINKLK